MEFVYFIGFIAVIAGVVYAREYIRRRAARDRAAHERERERSEDT